MLAKCARWESSGGNDATEAGAARHSALAWQLASEAPEATRAESLAQLDDADREAVVWAADYIRTHAPMADYPIHCERTLTMLDDEFKEVMRGTPDVVCGNQLFDLKWRERDYAAQMAAYALMLMEESGWSEVHVHVLYGERQRAERFTFTRDGAQDMVDAILANVASAQPPTPCDYCGWCARRLTCSALTTAAKTVADGYSVLDRVANWHPSEQTDAAQLSTMLFIARKVLKPWIESVEFHALDAITKQGLAIPGYELKTRKAREWISDVAGAFAAAGLPQDDFLRCCDVRLNTSKTYPDKTGIVDVFARVREMKKAAAKRELMSKLAPVMQTGKPTQYLAEIGEKEGEE
jgi:hypothetical protein